MIQRAAFRSLRYQRCTAPVPVRNLSSWARNVAEPSHNVQAYISKTDDPYLNLSIEHYLLENSPPQSAILFLYINRPCIVIGRNQNPWLEINLTALQAQRQQQPRHQTSPTPGNITLVRRRSGGGTVFHDHGNVNWTVICPSDIFTRDKHAEMVVRCLRQLGVARARVNDRHDLVLDQGSSQNPCDPLDLHQTPWTAQDWNAPRPLKVSGSAYKLTRGRALHHGTCLLTSPSLGRIYHYLQSPAKPFIKAKGVESVSSPVANLGIETCGFQEAVRREFMQLYRIDHQPLVEAELGVEMLQEPGVKRGFDELRTSEWLVDQTPQFSFGTGTAARSGEQSSLISPPDIRVHMDFRHGKVAGAKIALREDSQTSDDFENAMQNAIVGLQLRESWNWQEVLTDPQYPEGAQLGCWLDQMLPTGLASLLD